MYLSKLSQDHVPLAMKEMAVFSPDAVLEFPYAITPEEPSQLAFVSSYGKIISDLSEVNEPYHIRCKDSSISIAKIAKHIAQPVSMKGKQLLFLRHHKMDYMILGWRKNNHQFESRKSHRLPAPHPSSVHPKIARAMINLLNAPKGEAIQDPFCGAGSILIEAGILGYKIFGNDICREMIERAEKNLSKFSLQAELLCGDAKELDKEMSYIVCDLPYGRNTRGHPEDAWEIFCGLFEKYGKRAVVGMSSGIGVEHPNIEFSYTYRLHSSLSKTILLLSK